ncbi:hypothetical protein SAMN04488065_2861 [Haloplanus vescus]|uniref:Uncharacterized protein n=1 Tax=Haloplanus vescus TaxID=555874 RepID=A0A1H4ALM7_9EURY|nr:hypothetical protein SAMN04488065_2861 [Haloplanus vescus]
MRPFGVPILINHPGDRLPIDLHGRNEDYFAEMCGEATTGNTTQISNRLPISGEINGVKYSPPF